MTATNPRGSSWADLRLAWGAELEHSSDRCALVVLALPCPSSCSFSLLQGTISQWESAADQGLLEGVGF